MKELSREEMQKYLQSDEYKARQLAQKRARRRDLIIGQIVIFLLFVWTLVLSFDSIAQTATKYHLWPQLVIRS